MRPLRTFVAIALVAFLVGISPEMPLCAQQESEDWRQFRGPLGQGISTATNLPVRWGDLENVRWKTVLPGPGSSSPIVVGEHVYVTCYMGFGVHGERGSMDQLLRRLVCLWTKDGSILWQVDIEPKLPEQVFVREAHGFASSTPVSDGQWTYAFFGKSGVFGFDRLGRRKWRAQVGADTDDWGSATSPVLYGDLVIVNASVESGCLVALNKKTGKLVWRASGIRESWNTPILVDVDDGRNELVLAGRGSVVGFDPANGQLLWSCRTGNDSYIVPSLVAQRGVVYCIGGRSGDALAVRAGGRGDVTKSHRLWTILKGSNVSSPVLYDEHLYWMHDNLGIAYCVEAETGKLIYEQRVGGKDDVFASPIAADGKLYFVTRSGQTIVLAASPKYERLSINTLDDLSHFNASPAVANGCLFLRSDQALYCIGKP